MARIKHTAHKTSSRRPPPPGSASASRSPASTGPSSTPGTSTNPRRSPRKGPRTSASPRVPEASGQKKRRFRSGTVALREIRQFQKSWKLLIPKAPFIRTVREISNTLAPDITRWTVEALYAIQEQRIFWFIYLKMQCYVLFMQSVLP
ncbi:hypothetical protein BT93_B0125 [Corymbia citriodora subsp. variegata]|nr:hypothetical protein BT93_B0125 [Corymbia citriodora subsp. variegata]